eukprot:gene13031-8877_t
MSLLWASCLGRLVYLMMVMLIIQWFVLEVVRFRSCCTIWRLKGVYLIDVNVVYGVEAIFMGRLLAFRSKLIGLFYVDILTDSWIASDCVVGFCVAMRTGLFAATSMGVGWIAFPELRDSVVSGWRGFADIVMALLLHNDIIRGVRVSCSDIC